MPECEQGKGFGVCWRIGHEPCPMWVTVAPCSWMVDTGRVMGIRTCRNVGQPLTLSSSHAVDWETWGQKGVRACRNMGVSSIIPCPPHVWHIQRGGGVPECSCIWVQFLHMNPAKSILPFCPGKIYSFTFKIRRLRIGCGLLLHLIMKLVWNLCMS